MEAAAHLRLVGDTAADTFPWPGTGELVSFKDAQYRVLDLTDERDGLLKLTKKLARENAALSRRVMEDENPENHAKGAEIVEAIDYWRDLCNHPNSKVSGDRVKLVKARFKDGYDLADLKLAIDGLSSHPFRVYDKRLKTGRREDRHDQLSDALGSSEKLEKLANLGAQARKAGWTPEEGWPA